MKSIQNVLYNWLEKINGFVPVDAFFSIITWVLVAVILFLIAYGFGIVIGRELLGILVSGSL